MGLTDPPIADRGLTLFGTTPEGGIAGPGNAAGNGTVFKVAPPPVGATGWSKTTIYAFRSLDDGAAPRGRLVEDSHGVLYGMTEKGGLECSSESSKCLGTIYKSVPRDYGGHEDPWNKTSLHNFTASDGAFPSSLIGTVSFFNCSALFGTTIRGDTTHNSGTVFEIDP